MKPIIDLAADGFSKLVRRMSSEDKRLVSRLLKVNLTEGLRRRWGLTAESEFQAWETPDGLLLRPADPPLSKIIIEPTTDCNLACRTCMRNTWEEEGGEMSSATYASLLKGAKDIKSVRTLAFWGIGEPLTHPSIADMISDAKQAGYQTELITNGLLLDRNMAETLIKAGLDTIVISLDGVSPESHADIREGGDFSGVLDNIRGLAALRRETSHRNPEIGIEFVAMRRNLPDLKHLPSLARSLEATFIIVTNVLPYSEELKDEILYWLSAGDIYPQTRSKWRPEIQLPRFDSRQEIAEHLRGLSPHVIAGGSRPGGADGYCPFVWEGSISVSWKGEVSPCVALMHSYSCFILGRQKKIKAYSVGNVNRRRLSSIWNSDEFRKFRKKVREFEFSPCVSCGGCEMAESNEEDCIGATFPTCGDCLWARGILLCP